MCELFGASLKTPIELKKYLTEFYRHSEKHPHGWGMMRKVNGAYRVIKEPVKATDSQVLEAIVDEVGEQTNLLAHIRLATVGPRKPENCHPYTGVDTSGREWTLIHNGTMYSGKALMKYLRTQVGDTDSERVFMYLMDRINGAIEESGNLSAEKRFEIIEDVIRELSRRNKLNLMIFDGEILYIHKNMKNTLSYKELPEGVIFSTEPLDDGWKPLPMCKVFAYKAGEVLFEGNEKTEEFVPNLEYINAMAAMNI